MTKQRKMLFGAIALLLLAANFVRWWAGEHPLKRDVKATAHADIRPEDLVLRLDTRSETQPAGRDPFAPKIIVAAHPPIKKVVTPTPPPGPPPKTPEELEQDAARAELAAIKLVGVVFKGEAAQAFLVKGDQVFLAVIGDKVGSRFTVDKITADSVTLNDPKTAVSGSVSISGG